MRKKVIIIVSCTIVVALLSTFSIYALMSDEAPRFSAEVKKLDLPDASYTPPEVEEEPVQSQPPVEAETTPWAIVKVASELPLLTPESTKTVTVPGKAVTAAYTGKEYREWANTTPYHAYKADDGDILWFDAVGGELVRYELAEKPEETDITISIDEAQVVAETFAREHIDLSRYTPTCQNTLHDGNYWFQYVRYIGDMPTQDIANVIISPSGVLLEYGANPHLFDCVQIGAVDKAAIRQRFEEKLREKGQSTDYTLKGEIIGLNNLGEPCVKYSYYYAPLDGAMIAINTMEIPLTEQAE